MDLEIREFSQKLIKITNSSALPMEVKRLCFFEIMEQLKIETNKCIDVQFQEKYEKEKKGEDNE